MKYMLLVLSVLAVSACSKKDPVTEPGFKQSTDELSAVATVAANTITRAELDYELAYFSTGPKDVSLQQREKVLQNMINDQVFYNKAIENGFDKSPQFLLNQRKLLAHEYRKYLQEKIGEEVKVEDWAVEAYYTANQDEYSKPAKYRMAIIFQRKASQHARSLEQISIAAQTIDVKNGFGKQAQYSDDIRSRNRGGKLAWVSGESTISGVPQQVFSEGRTLKVGDVSDIIHTDKGDYLVRLIDKRDREITAFKAVKGQIKHALMKKRQHDKMTDYLEQAQSAYEITIHEENLKPIKTKSNAQSFGPPGLSAK